MEIEFSDKTYILPSTMVGQEEIFKIVADETGDCIIETERELKSGKGKFKQYELLLENKHKEPRSAQFLMLSHIKPLLREYSQNTKDWIGQYVLITGEPEEKGENVFYSLILIPTGLPDWAQEKV